MAFWCISFDNPNAVDFAGRNADTDFIAPIAPVESVLDLLGVVRHTPFLAGPAGLFLEIRLLVPALQAGWERLDSRPREQERRLQRAELVERADDVKLAKVHLLQARLLLDVLALGQAPGARRKTRALAESLEDV